MKDLQKSAETVYLLKGIPEAVERLRGQMSAKSDGSKRIYGYEVYNRLIIDGLKARGIIKKRDPLYDID